MSVPTVTFATLGCRLNQVDTQELQGALEARGFCAVPFGAPADVVVVNTCTVTARAELSDRQAIRRAIREHAGARLVVTGCWAQVDPRAVAGLGGVDLVVGNADKLRLPQLIADMIHEGRTEIMGGLERAPRAPRRSEREARVVVSPIGAARTLPEGPLGRVDGRSRAFLKIQDGCQHRCAFCIVPFARGPSRSREPDGLLDQARRLVDDGHREIVLTGVDMGHYGADLVPRTSLASLLRHMVEIPGLRWVRLSSVLPAYFTPELVELATTSPVIAPHFHIPLQSGSDRILRRMRRPYTVAMYRRLVERLATAIPALGLGTDLIAGFPGEAEEDFALTRALVEALPFTYLHVFTYSDRRGTEAARLDGHLRAGTITGRGRVLRDLGRTKNVAFRRSRVGSREDVLVLATRDRETGGLVGLTGNYVEVVFDGPDALMRRVVPVRVRGADRGRTIGALEAEADTPEPVLAEMAGGGSM